VFKTIFTLLVLSVSALASAASVDISIADSDIAAVSYAIGLVGGAVLTVYLAVDVFRYLRQAVGGSSPGGVQSHQDKYLRGLAERLGAEDAAAGVEWRDVGTGKSNLDYEAEELASVNVPGVLVPTYRPATIEEEASWQRVLDRHDRAEDMAREALSSHTWLTDTDGSQYRMHSITVAGVEKALRFEYEDEFNQARDEALEDMERGDGVTNAQLVQDKEDRKGYDMQALGNQ
jgi:uncharacterized protein YbjQ (UPF0145 family)